MFCIKCGTEYQIEELPVGKSKLCKNCGELLYKGDATNFTQKHTTYFAPLENQSRNQTYSTNQNKNLRTATYIFVGVLLVIILATSGWYFTHYHKYTYDVPTEESVATEAITETVPTAVIVDSTSQYTFDNEVETYEQVETENRVKLENPLENRTSVQSNLCDNFLGIYESTTVTKDNEIVTTTIIISKASGLYRFTNSISSNKTPRPLKVLDWILSCTESGNLYISDVDFILDSNRDLVYAGAKFERVDKAVWQN